MTTLLGVLVLSIVLDYGWKRVHARGTKMSSPPTREPV